MHIFMYVCIPIHTHTHNYIWNAKHMKLLKTLSWKRHKDLWALIQDERYN